MRKIDKTKPALVDGQQKQTFVKNLLAVTHWRMWFQYLQMERRCLLLLIKTFYWQIKVQILCQNIFKNQYMIKLAANRKEVPSKNNLITRNPINKTSNLNQSQGLLLRQKKMQNYCSQPFKILLFTSRKKIRMYIKGLDQNK